MSRFLFVVPPLAGHVNPAAAVAQALAVRGHQVAWAGSQARLSALLGPDALVYPTGMRLYRGRADTGMAAVKSLWEGFVVPFARFTLASVERAVEAYQPDVLAVDQHALAGALAAQRHGLPWATMCASTMELTRPLRGMPKIEDWINGLMAGLWAEARMPGEVPDLRFSPHLVLAFTDAALTGGYPFPEHFALVGPALSDRPSLTVFPWDRLDPRRRHVLVTVGTLAQDIAADSADFYARAAEALRLAGDSVQGIVIAPDGVLPGPAGHLLVIARAPVLELMPQLDAVVCHGGLNTVCEALSAGVPLVIAPIRHDQPVTAAQVAAAGAGIRVRFGRVSPDQLRAAILAVLDDPAYRAAAGKVRDSFAAAGGAQAAAERLERLARPGPRSGAGPAPGA
jgi:UDP:flavonoid glycosyltransferase YjiC (YdhE family)